MANYRHHNW